jgi:hypothetical protein
LSPQTEMARRMAAVVGELRPLFRERGFRKRRSTFNRTTEPGLVHVVAFTMGRYELYGEQHDPFSGDYGFYQIDYGVFVEEISRRLQGRSGIDFVTEPDCELRLSSTRLEGAPNRGWYLGDDLAPLVEEASGLLTGTVLPYLDRLSTRDAILRSWEQEPETVPLTRRRLAIAMIELERGNRNRAAELVQAHLDSGIHPGHRDWVLQNVTPQLE